MKKLLGLPEVSIFLVMVLVTVMLLAGSVKCLMGMKKTSDDSAAKLTDGYAQDREAYKQAKRQYFARYQVKPTRKKEGIQKGSPEDIASMNAAKEAWKEAWKEGKTTESALNVTSLVNAPTKATVIKDLESYTRANEIKRKEESSTSFFKENTDIIKQIAEENFDANKLSDEDITRALNLFKDKKSLNEDEAVSYFKLLNGLKNRQRKGGANRLSVKSLATMFELKARENTIPPRTQIKALNKIMQTNNARLETLNSEINEIEKKVKDNPEKADVSKNNRNLKDLQDEKDRLLKENEKIGRKVSDLIMIFEGMGKTEDTPAEITGLGADEFQKRKNIFEPKREEPKTVETGSKWKQPASTPVPRDPDKSKDTKPKESTNKGQEKFADEINKNLVISEKNKNELTNNLNSNEDPEVKVKKATEILENEKDNVKNQINAANTPEEKAWIKNNWKSLLGAFALFAAGVGVGIGIGYLLFDEDDEGEGEEGEEAVEAQIEEDEEEEEETEVAPVVEVIEATGGGVLDKPIPFVPEPAPEAEGTEQPISKPTKPEITKEMLAEFTADLLKDTKPESVSEPEPAPEREPKPELIAEPTPRPRPRPVLLPRPEHEHKPERTRPSIEMNILSEIGGSDTPSELMEIIGTEELIGR